jgi:hypothetical protein
MHSRAAGPSCGCPEPLTADALEVQAKVFTQPEELKATKKGKVHLWSIMRLGRRIYLGVRGVGRCRGRRSVRRLSPAWCCGLGWAGG